MKDTEFIQWVKDRLQEYKWKQHDLALRTGCSDASVCRWLRNERRIPLKFVNKCTNVFGYKMELRRKTNE